MSDDGPRELNETDLEQIEGWLQDGSESSAWWTYDELAPRLIAEIRRLRQVAVDEYHRGYVDGQDGARHGKSSTMVPL